MLKKTKRKKKEREVLREIKRNKNVLEIFSSKR